MEQLLLQLFLQQKIKMDVLEKYNIRELELDGDRIFLKKSKYFKWNVVHPYKIDGKIHWKNLIAGGNWWNLVWVTLAVGIIIGCLSEYVTMAKVANECMDFFRSTQFQIKF